MHKQLHISQRRIIERMNLQGSSQAAIARAIGVHRSTVNHELERNSFKGVKYDAEVAEILCRARKKVAGKDANARDWFMASEGLLRKHFKKAKQRNGIYKKIRRTFRQWQRVKDMRFLRNRKSPLLSYFQLLARKEYLQRRRRDHIQEDLRRLRFWVDWIKYYKAWIYELSPVKAQELRERRIGSKVRQLNPATPSSKKCARKVFPISTVLMPFLQTPYAKWRMSVQTCYSLPLVLPALGPLEIKYFSVLQFFEKLSEKTSPIYFLKIKNLKASLTQI